MEHFRFKFQLPQIVDLICISTKNTRLEYFSLEWIIYVFSLKVKGFTDATQDIKNSSQMHIPTTSNVWIILRKMILKNLKKLPHKINNFIFIALALQQVKTMYHFLYCRLYMGYITSFYYISFYYRLKN